jgi:hypothetical protein
MTFIGSIGSALYEESAAIDGFCTIDAQDGLLICVFIKKQMNKSIFILFTGLGEAIAMAPLWGAKKVWQKNF